MRLAIATAMLTGMATAYFLVEPQPVTCRAIDGDTVSCSNGEHIRLQAVDAPELSEVGGQAAKATLNALVLDKPAHIRYSGQRSYGRLVGDVLVEQADGTKASAVCHMLNSGTTSLWQQYDPHRTIEKECFK